MPNFDSPLAFAPTDLAHALQHATVSGLALDAAVWQQVQSAADVLGVHQARAHMWGDTERAPLHWKSGGASRSQPLSHAPLPPQGVRGTDADFGDIPFLLRGVEAEIALRMGCDVDAEAAARLGEADAAALVDAMAVSIEIVDSRWQQQLQAPEALKAADLLCHGALVLGEWQPYHARDWALQRCAVQVGRQPLAERQGSHSLLDPAWLLSQWLRHATRHFGTVQAGTVVTTGSWCGLLLAAKGDAIRVCFDGIGEAALQL